MARAALRLSLGELAELSGVSEKTIRRCEAVIGLPAVSEQTIVLLREALEKLGVRFSEARGRTYGPGCTLDWNPEHGERDEVHGLIQREGDPFLGGRRYDWVPSPKKPEKPKGDVPPKASKRKR